MDAIIKRLNQIHYKKLIWVIAISETIHNLEEAIWLPASSQAGIGQLSVSAFEFRFALTMVTLIFYAVIFYFAVYDNKIARFLMGGALVVILFNVFMPHLIATIVTFHYAPGVISGIFLNVPVSLYLLWRGVNEGVYKTSTLVYSGLAFTVTIVPLLLVFFALGRLFESIL